MKPLLMLFVVMIGISSLAMAQTNDLFISEYVEGSGFNKALEIFNGSGDPIDLGNYSLKRYSNGSTSGTVIALSEINLVPGDAFVIAHSSADPALLNLADQTSAEISFNGDDAMVLVRNGNVVDSIGQVGFDPGSAWTCTEGSTANATLRRVSSFCVGDTTVDDAFDPCETFDFYPSDEFSDLGMHLADCTSVANGRGTWGSLKAAYR